MHARGATTARGLTYRYAADYQEAGLFCSCRFGSPVIFQRLGRAHFGILAGRSHVRCGYQMLFSRRENRARDPIPEPQQLLAQNKMNDQSKNAADKSSMLFCSYV